jgi:hypothetical protein
MTQKCAGNTVYALADRIIAGVFMSKIPLLRRFYASLISTLGQIDFRGMLPAGGDRGV